MVDVKRGRELLAAYEATDWPKEPGHCEDGGWSAIGPLRECEGDEDTDEPESPCHKRAQADQALVRWLLENREALLSAAERVENDREWDAAFDAEVEAKQAAERRVAELERAIALHDDVARVRVELEARAVLAEKRVAELEERNLALACALDRDKTGLAAALDQCRKAAASRMWVTEGRGPYEWDDDEYREEAGRALREVIDIAWKALAASGTIANELLSGPTPRENEIQRLRDRLDAAERRVAELEAEQKQTLAGFLSASEALIDERENEREAHISAERARDEWKAKYYDLADAVARESTSHDDLCNQARETRRARDEAVRRAESAEAALERWENPSDGQMYKEASVLSLRQKLAQAEEKAAFIEERLCESVAALRQKCAEVAHHTSGDVNVGHAVGRIDVLPFVQDGIAALATPDPKGGKP